MPKSQFFSDLDTLIAQRKEEGFFRDLDFIIAERKRDRDHYERYWARRRASQRRAVHLQSYINRVEKFDPWKTILGIDPEFYFTDELYEKEMKLRIKRLINKQLRLLWTLRALHHYLIGDKAHPGSKRSLKYTVHRRMWYRNLKTHKEKVRQARWDEKRARVRSRRAKKKENTNGEVSILDPMYELQDSLHRPKSLPCIRETVQTDWD